jgi:hypothetical protein
MDRIGIEISGAAAKAMYDALLVKEREDECTNALVKTTGSLACSKAPLDKKASAPTYYCQFGFILKTGKSVNPWEC